VKPLGRDRAADDQGQRHGWVSYGLAGLMLLVFAASWLMAAERRERADTAVAAAVGYFERNPGVQLGPRLAAIVGRARAAETREIYLEERRRMGLPLVPGRIQRLTQQRFEPIEREAIARLDDLPAARHALRPAGSEAPSYLVHVFQHEGPVALVVSLLLLLSAGVALERAWGSALYGSFCLGATLLGGVAYLVIDGDVGMPWAGGGGLLAAMLGAYLVRTPRGIALPGFVLLPVWLAVDALLVRGVSPSDPGALAALPLATYALLAALGALFAFTLNYFGVESRGGPREPARAAAGPDPALAEAFAARDQGRSEEACDLLASAYERAPGQTDVALAYWEMARGAGRAEQAATALVSVIRTLLRGSDDARAVELWRELTRCVEDVRAEPVLRVRVGERLLDEGHPEEALAVLRHVVDETEALPSALAQRIVRIARDLDPALTKRAARLALADADLRHEERADLETLAAERVAAPPIAELPAASPEPTAEIPEPAFAPETDKAELFDLDPHALSSEMLEEAVKSVDEAPVPVEEVHETAEASPLEAPSCAPDSDVEPVERPSAVPEAVSDAATARDGLGDVSDELSDADLEDGHLADLVALSLSSVDPSEADTAVEMERAAETQSADATPALRVRDALPLGFEGDSLAVEVGSRGKTLVPIERVDAVALAAVGGLGAKPVLVLDLALDWQGPTGDALRLLRLRSDRFDPRKLVSDEPSPLAALLGFVGELMRRSDALALPHAAALRGDPLASFDDLASYEEAVFGARG